MPRIGPNPGSGLSLGTRHNITKQQEDVEQTKESGEYLWIEINLSFSLAGHHFRAADLFEEQTKSLLADKFIFSKASNWMGLSKQNRPANFYSSEPFQAISGPARPFQAISWPAKAAEAKFQRSVAKKGLSGSRKQTANRKKPGLMLLKK